MKILMPAAAAGLVLMLSGCGGGSSDSMSGAPTPENVAVSGAIDIESGTRVDADSANELRLNSGPRTGAQSLPQEFVLAGYVSAFNGSYPPLGGLAGFSYYADPDDSFSLRLLTGQSVELQAFATREGSAPLRLSLSDGSDEIAFATTSASQRQVSVALGGGRPDGNYTLKVEAVGDKPMLYILNTSAAASSTTASYRWSDHDFVEGEAVIAMTPQASAASVQALASDGAMVPQQELAPGLWRVQAPDLQALSAQGTGKSATLDWIRALKARPDLASVTPNYRVKTFATPVDEPLYNNIQLGQQWHYGLLDGPTAWQLATGPEEGGDGVIVAVMDTGLYGQPPDNWHSDLNANVVAGNDFVSASFDNDGAAEGGSGPDNNPSDPGNAVGSSVYHGTHVAGTVAAAVNNSGGGGVAYNSSLMPVRVLGEGGTGSSADLEQAIRWVSELSSGSPRANIVNLSLGGLPFIQSLQNAINTATSRGVIFVAAAGNSATNSQSYPAAFENVFAVSAVDGAGNLASYSNFGSWIDLAAPGGDASRDGNADGRGDLVSSTSASVIEGSLQETYIGLQGTSMAAPHASGVVALMKGVKPTLTFEDINALLQTGDLTVPPCEAPCMRTNQLGYGLLDAGKSVLAALDGSIPDILTPSPAIASLSSEGAQTATINLKVYGSAPNDVTFNSLSSPPDWLIIEQAPTPGDAGVSFDITLRLNPSALEPGVSERTALTVAYTGDQGRTLEIPVVGQQISDREALDAGEHFVLLVEPEPDGEIFNTVAQASVRPEDGEYRFSFRPDDGVEPEEIDEVPPGQYILVAGSDLDNDGLICHAGEACAEYPVAGLRQEIVVAAGQPVTGLRMTTSYSRPTISAASPEQLPRPGFQGYRLLQSAGSSTDKITNDKALANP